MVNVPVLINPSKSSQHTAVEIIVGNRTEVKNEQTVSKNSKLEKIYSIKFIKLLTILKFALEKLIWKFSRFSTLINYYFNNNYVHLFIQVIFFKVIIYERPDSRVILNDF